MRRLVAVLFLGALASFGPHPRAQAQYPERAATLITGFPIGGLVDTVTRALAEGMRRNFPKGLEVLNRTGTDGVIAIEGILRAKPDGYTLALTPKSALIVQPQALNLIYKSPDDVAVILNVVAFYPLLVAPRDSAIGSPAEFLAAARAAPGTLRVGTPGVGTSQHLALEDLKRQAGIDVVHVPFKSWAESGAALLGGQIDLAIAQPGELAALIDARRVRAVGVFRPARNPAYPDTPTFKEAGHDASYATLFSLIAPQGTPPEVLKYIHDAAKEAMEQRAFVELMRSRHVEIEYRSGEKLRADLLEEYRAHTELLRNAGMLKK